MNGTLVDWLVSRVLAWFTSDTYTISRVVIAFSKMHPTYIVICLSMYHINNDALFLSIIIIIIISLLLVSLLVLLLLFVIITFIIIIIIIISIVNAILILIIIRQLLFTSIPSMKKSSLSWSLNIYCK